jgi:hypothetical protein
MVVRRVFTDGLPKRKGKTEQIDWKKCIGYSVHFIYNDIEGDLPILNIIQKNGKSYIITEYGKNKEYLIASTDFARGTLGGLLGVKTESYKYNVGDIIDIKGKKLQILEQTRMPQGSHTTKGYKYKCLNCNNIDKKSESDFNQNSGCNVCSVDISCKIVREYNDLWTTHPHIANMLKDKELGYTISYGSRVEQLFICPFCGFEKKISPKAITSYGIACPRCSDGISYPEKFVFKFLEQIGASPIKQKMFDWSKNIKHDNKKLNGDKKYDFYIIHNGKTFIIETHGRQHYEKTNGNRRSFEVEQENDKLKEKLAKDNNIDEYIVLDCRNSELNYIKESIVNSKLSKIFDLSNVNWRECNEYACKSLVKPVCDLWSKGIFSIVEIGKMLNISKYSVKNYIVQGSKIGWCKYNGEKEILKKNESQMKQVICVNYYNDIVYNSITDASEKTGICRTTLGLCCLGKGQSAGMHPETGEPLVWMFYEDFLNADKEMIKRKLSLPYAKLTRRKPVIQLNLNNEFVAEYDGTSFVDGYNTQCISKACLGNYPNMSNGHQYRNYIWYYKSEYEKMNLNGK